MSDQKPRFKGLKKQTSTTSVDGFVPQRKPQLSTPQYYSKGTTISGGPRRPLKTRQTIPTETLDVPDDDETPTLGNFDQPEQDVFSDKGEGLQPRNSRRRGNDKDKKEKKPGRIRAWWKSRSLKFKLGLVGGIILIALLSAAGIRIYSFLNSVFGRSVGNSSSALNDRVRPEDLNTEGDGRLNMLLMGRGGTENSAPDLTDTILIASIDLKNQSASMLSIPRDTWIQTNGTNTKINATYALAKQSAMAQGKSEDAAEDAGIKAIIGVVRNVAGVPIHKYVLTDYKAFRDVVNALGGVTINNPEAIYDNFTGWRFPAGKQKMDGLTALKYARTRHGSTRGDFDRNENQRRLLIAMRSKATSTGIVANPVRLNSLANAVQKNIRTDLSLDEAKRLFGKTKELPEKMIKSLDLAKPDGPLIMTGNVGGQSIVRPQAGFGDFSKIKAYARGNMVDPYLAAEAPTVAVYNSTGKTGLATTVGEVLASLGYKVLAKETGASTQPKTLVVKMNKDAKKPFTERFLGIRFKTVLTGTLPANVVPTPKTPKSSTTSTTAASAPSPDYIIVLGSDFATPSGPTW